MIFRSWVAPVVLASATLGSPGAIGAAIPDAEVQFGRPIVLEIRPAPGFKINESAPNRLTLREEGTGPLRAWKSRQLGALQIVLGKMPASGRTWVLEASLYSCQTQNSQVCLTQKIEQRVRGSAAATTHRLEWALRGPSPKETSSPNAPSVR